MSRYVRVQEGVVVEVVLVEGTFQELLLDEDGVGKQDDEGNFIYRERPLELSDLYTEDLLSSFVKTAVNARADLGWRYDGEKFSPPETTEERPLPPVVLPASVLYERMTDEEFDIIDASVEDGESRRIYRAFAVEVEFREGGEMWALLVKHMGLVGITAERQAELLTPPPFAMLAVAQTE